MNSLNQPRTHSDLLERLSAAAKRGITREEMKRQRVNYIVGAMGGENSKLTPDAVEKELEKLYGSDE